jgi:subtilisin-like proprotein convertase family protein
MKIRCTITLLLLVIPLAAQAGSVTDRLNEFLADESQPVVGVWVRFTDKDLQGETRQTALIRESQRLSTRTLDRRSRAARPGQDVVDERDLPLAESYLSQVLSTGAELRRQSRWFNAASFNATESQIRQIARLACVQQIDLVARFRRALPGTDSEEASSELPVEKAQADSDELNYGGTQGAADLINLPPVHARGLSGQGVIVAVLDAGFVLTHESFQHLPILDQWDFVHDDGNVQWEPGDHEWQDHHGTQVLSTLAGFSDGHLIGTAFGSSVILAMTEDTGDETIVEEDNWVAAVEWVEAGGADLITSSLGYYYWYEYADLDGDTALVTRAADMAVGRGMGVFTSAGNERNNEDWPYLTAPADGDSVVAVGAVDLAGNVAGFSSPGPTYDGRIKPDVAALGVSNHGIAALMLERIPILTPMQIREALRATASQGGRPDNDMGWGIIDASAAIAYWGPSIDHIPLVDTENDTGPYLINALITDRSDLDEGSLFLYWRVDGGSWNPVALAPLGGGLYQAPIPGAAGGGLIEYYLEAGDVDGYLITAPYAGPAQPWSFTVGIDITAPSLFHPTLTDQTLTIWPPLVFARASDNQGIDRVEVTFQINGGAVQGPVNLVPGADAWELDFPLAAGQLSEGDILTYQVTAVDLAASPNTAISGPHEVRILSTLGHVVIIDDLPSASEPAPKDALNLTASFDQWLSDAGWTTEIVSAGAVSGTQLAGADAVFLTSGNNPYPLGDSAMRSLLIAYAEGGGKILVEGGEAAQACFHENQYLDFATSVLRSAEFWGDIIGPLNVATDLVEHPFMYRPNILPEVISQDMSPNPYDYFSSDIVLPDQDSFVVLTSSFNSDVGGVLLHDDNTGPEGGQIVYITLDLGYMPEPQARPLVINCLTYLTGREAPGNASIAGTVSLTDSGDASGVRVEFDPDHFVVTGPDGAFVFEGFHGGTHTLTASLEGYSSESLTFELGADEALTGLALELQPALQVELVDTPEIPIPDNDDTGLTRTMQVDATGQVQAISIDVDIEHPSIGHLVIRLTSPSGTTMTLHDNSGGIADDLVGNWPATLVVDGPGSLDDFLGEPANGAWQLQVADTGWGALGTWHSWGLNLTVTQSPSAVGDVIPRQTRILGNRPNPFNPRTTVMFEMGRESTVELAIFDLRGARVRTLETRRLAAGKHEISWDGRDDQDRQVVSGIYFFRMQTENESLVRKMTLVK